MRSRPAQQNFIFRGSAAGDDLHGAAAAVAGFDVDLEHAFQAPGPAHGGVTL